MLGLRINFFLNGIFARFAEDIGSLPTDHCSRVCDALCLPITSVLWQVSFKKDMLSVIPL